MSLSADDEYQVTWSMMAFNVVEEIVKKSPGYSPVDLEWNRQIIIEHRDDAKYIVPILEMLWPYAWGLDD